MKADAMWRQLAAMNLTQQFNASTSSSLVRGEEVTLQHGLRQGTKFKAGGITVEDMRMRNFTQRDLRVTTDRTPYSNIILRSGTDQDIGFMVGKFDQTWERLREAKDRGIEWFVEVIIDVSSRKRNRTVGVSLHTPDAKMPEKTLLLSSHMEAMEDKRRHYSKLAAEWRFIFEEEDDRFDGVHLSAGMKDKNIRIPGLIRLIEEITSTDGNPWGVTGDPMIRVSLASSAGICMQASHLKQDLYRGVLYAWLQDMVEFFSGDGRFRTWDSRSQQFRYVGDKASRTPSAPIDEILKGNV